VPHLDISLLQVLVVQQSCLWGELDSLLIIEADGNLGEEFTDKEGAKELH
jgi:hypothetical protein